MINKAIRIMSNLSLTAKAICVTATVGLVSWTFADWYQSYTLGDIYSSRLLEEMRIEAFEGRNAVHKRFKAFFKLGEFITSGRGFSEYIDGFGEGWSAGKTHVKIHRQQPPWYPKASLLSLFPDAHYALLFDSRERIREVYIRNSGEYPKFLQKPMEYLPQLSWDSSFLTQVDGKPFAITSDTLLGADGKPKAILLLATPIDEEFLFISKLPEPHYPVALVEGVGSTIMASSNQNLLPPGTELSELDARYFVVGEAFYDYGNSDLLIRYAVFTPKEKVRAMTEAFISQERYDRALSIFAIIGIFLVIMIQISRRVEKMAHRVGDFSRQAFGGEPIALADGDELARLEERFHHLTETVVNRTAELVEEERSHRTLAENLPGIAYRLFLRGDRHMQFFNVMLEPITGYTEEELKAGDLSCMDFLIFPEDRETVLKAVNKSIEERTPFEVEYRIRRKDGAVRHCVERGKPIYDDDGEASHIDGIIIDATERKKAAEALMLAQFTLDSAADPVFWIAQDARIIYVNDAACKSLGYSMEELLSMTIDNIDPNYPAGRWAEQWELVMKRGHVVMETEHRAKGGRVFPVEITANYIRYVDGEYLCVFARDISDWVRAEMELREGKQFLSNILESLQDGLCIIGSDRDIIMANRTMEEWFGRREPVVGRKCFEVIRERGEACVPCPALETMKTGQSSFDTVPFRRPGGVKGWLDIYSFPLRAMQTDEVTGVILYLRDVTDKVAFQAEAARTAQLASLGELAAGVAHEINNPINGIINYAQILSNKLPNGSKGDIARRIIKEGDRVSEIVRSLLSFSRDEGDWRTAVSVSDMLMEVLSLIGSQLRKEGICLASDVKPDLPKVNVNRQQIEQVFLNVINNARHALRQKYPVADENSAIEIWAEAVSFSGDYYVRVTFRDRGVGIPQELLTRVASPFFTTKSHGSGTGLGLSISQNIINNHGGRLAIDSVEGEYTQVAIDLPQRRESDG